MSFVSCDNSALIVPASFPYGAVGSTIAPTINTTLTNSGATLQTFPSFTLPKGVWLASGILWFDAVTGGQTLNGHVVLQSSGVAVWRWNQTSQTDGASVVLSCMINSDGTKVMTLPATFTTSGGSQFGASNINTGNLIVQFTRVA